MIGIVMAGGKGTRMRLDDEKLLLKYKKPIILHVIDSLNYSNCFSKILAITSINSPKTKKLLQENNIETFDTNGIGYVEDLNSVLQTLDDDVMITSGDLPLLKKEDVQKIVKQYNSENIWTSVLVTNKFLISLGLQSEYSINFEDKKCHFTGISLVNSKKISSLEKINEDYLIIDERNIAFNLNTKEEYDLLCTS